MHGHVPAVGIILSIVPVVFAGGFLYFLYQINKSLKRIANHLEKK